MLSLFKKFGRDLFLTGLNASHSGNISIRSGDKLFISRTGCMLGDIQEGDVVSADINDSQNTGIASREIIVHRNIYRNTKAKAIIHAHPPYTIIMSILEKEIIPVDSEGNFFLKSVPVFETVKTIGSEEVAERIPGLLIQHGKIAVLKYHGSFAIGENLEESFLWTTTLEKSAQMAYLLKTANPVIYHKTILKYKNK
ncbi:aldolase [Candidatus Dependentiae bacterium]|nr:aldolase [Candidatus Dependentiae bacterium]